MNYTTTAAYFLRKYVFLVRTDDEDCIANIIQSNQRQYGTIKQVTNLGSDRKRLGSSRFARSQNQSKLNKLRPAIQQIQMAVFSYLSRDPPFHIYLCTLLLHGCDRMASSTGNQKSSGSQETNNLVTFFSPDVKAFQINDSTDTSVSWNLEFYDIRFSW